MKILPGTLNGEIVIQPSKSYLHRMIIMAALSEKAVDIENVNYSDDVLATLNALSTMGLCTYEKGERSVTIKSGDGILKGEVECNESGSTLRFLIALGLTMNKEIIFTGKGRLMERPLNIYEDLCKEKDWIFEKEGCRLKIKGNMTSGHYSLAGNVSSQFISGLMMALGTYTNESVIEITGKVESIGYIDITAEVMKKFGVSVERCGNVIKIYGGITPPKKVYVEGDWSHAANYLCVGAAIGGLTLKGLNTASAQKDSSILALLKQMNGNINIEDNAIILKEASLKGTDFDGSDIPDIVPVLCVLLGVCKGTHTISGIGRLRIKESDRIESTCKLINSIGGRAESSEDSITTYGVESYTGGKVCSYNDHRIAMAAAVASCFCNGTIELDNSECVNKSAPQFWQEFVALGGKVEE